MPDLPSGADFCGHNAYSPGCLCCEVDHLLDTGDTLTPGDCCRRCGLWVTWCRCGPQQQLGPEPVVYSLARAAERQGGGDA